MFNIIKIENNNFNTSNNQNIKSGNVHSYYKDNNIFNKENNNTINLNNIITNKANIDNKLLSNKSIKDSLKEINNNLVSNMNRMFLKNRIKNKVSSLSYKQECESNFDINCNDNTNNDKKIDITYYRESIPFKTSNNNINAYFKQISASEESELSKITEKHIGISPLNMEIKYTDSPVVNSSIIDKHKFKLEDESIKNLFCNNNNNEDDELITNIEDMNEVDYADTILPLRLNNKVNDNNKETYNNNYIKRYNNILVNKTPEKKFKNIESLNKNNFTPITEAKNINDEESPITHKSNNKSHSSESSSSTAKLINNNYNNDSNKCLSNLKKTLFKDSVCNNIITKDQEINMLNTSDKESIVKSNKKDNYKLKKTEDNNESNNLKIDILSKNNFLAYTPDKNNILQKNIAYNLREKVKCYIKNKEISIAEKDKIYKAKSAVLKERLKQNIISIKKNNINKSIENSENKNAYLSKDASILNNIEINNKNLEEKYNSYKNVIKIKESNESIKNLNNINFYKFNNKVNNTNKFLNNNNNNIIKEANNSSYVYNIDKINCYDTSKNKIEINITTKNNNDNNNNNNNIVKTNTQTPIKSNNYINIAKNNSKVKINSINNYINKTANSNKIYKEINQFKDFTSVIVNSNEKNLNNKLNTNMFNKKSNSQNINIFDSLDNNKRTTFTGFRESFSNRSNYINHINSNSNLGCLTCKQVYNPKQILNIININNYNSTNNFNYLLDESGVASNNNTYFNNCKTFLNVSNKNNKFKYKNIENIQPKTCLIPPKFKCKILNNNDLNSNISKDNEINSKVFNNNDNCSLNSDIYSKEMDLYYTISNNNKLSLSNILKSYNKKPTKLVVNDKDYNIFNTNDVTKKFKVNHIKFIDISKKA